MKCEICYVELPPMHNSVVCSDKCSAIRKHILQMSRKYAPTPGCANCRGDLHQGCTEECKKEFQVYGEFFEDARELMRLLREVPDA